MKLFYTSLSTLLFVLAALSNSTLASEPQQGLVIEPSEPIESLFVVTEKDSPNSLLLDLDYVPKQPVDIKKETTKEFSKGDVIAIKYENLVEDFDANIGIVKTRKINSKIKSGALPRGRYFKPNNAKLGAAISRKF